MTLIVTIVIYLVNRFRQPPCLSHLLSGFSSGLFVPSFRADYCRLTRQPLGTWLGWARETFLPGTPYFLPRS
jgi:Kef-type K+ transport system membrane component KefB